MKTLWLVFSSGFLDATKAPPDAPEWLDKGYLRLVQQGKLTGYAIARPGYELIVGVLR